MGFRISAGKKIGGVYIGASKTIGSGNKRNKGGGGCWIIGIAILFFPFTLAYLFGKWAYNKTQQQKAANPEKVWYKQTWGIILMLILFFPVGIYLMWKYGKHWNLYIKIAVCVAFGVISIIVLLSSGTKEVIDNNSSISESLEINEQIAVKYEANTLARRIDEDKEFEKSLEGTKIELTGIVKENKLNHSEIYIEGDFEYGGWYQCEMSDETDVNKVSTGDIAVIEGVVKRFSGHLYMEECILIKFESPTETPTKKTTPKETEPPTEESTEVETEEIIEETEPEIVTHDYVINYNTGKFHKPSCYTIEDADNIGTYTGTKEELEEQGYEACKKCKPY